MNEVQGVVNSQHMTTWGGKNTAQPVYDRGECQVATTYDHLG